MTVLASTLPAARAARVARGTRSRVAATRLALARTTTARTRTATVRVATSRGRDVEICCRIDPSDYEVFEEVFLKRCYNVDASHVATADVDVVLDLGANVGMASAYLHSLFPQAHIISVEPLPDNIELLRSTASANDAQWDVVNAAIGSAPGSASLHWSRWYGSGTLDPSIAAQRQGDPERPESALAELPLEVEVLPVADVLARCGRQSADIVKLDIEGAEQDVVRGDASWLRAARAVIIEVHERYIDGPAVRNELHRAGLRPTGYGGQRSELWLRPEPAR